MKYGSVCSGIEAATVAWHPLGWEASFYSEIDAFPREVLQHHYPDVPLHGDFTTIQGDDYDPIELLVGGTPCQSFSVAGLRKGLDDPRGNLMLGFGALAKCLGPTWLVWENVPGVLSANRGRDFGTFLGMLAELGYGFAYRVLDAQFFGVAQRRRRVFVVGYLGDWRPAAAVLFERHSLSGHPAPSREKGQESSIAPTLRAGGNRTGGDRPPGTDVDTADSLQPVPILEPGARTGKSTTDLRAGLGIGEQGDPMFTLQAGKQHGVAARMRGFGDYTLDEVASTLNARDAKDAKDLVTCVHGTQDPCVSDRAHALGRNNGQENAVFVSLRGREGGATAELGGNLAGTLRAATGGGDKPHVMCFAQNSRDEVRLMPYAGALAAEPGMKQTSYVFQERGRATGRELEIGGPVAYALTAPAGGGRSQERNILDAPRMAVRRLTPVECERLQGFPDNYTLIPTTAARQVEEDYFEYLRSHCSGLSLDEAKRLSKDGPRYKALGNSMAVPVMAWLGRRIDQVDSILADQRKEAA